jgi:hypothetical protein
MNDTTHDDDDAGNKTLKWGTEGTETFYDVSPADVPAISLFALAQRGLTHVLGNEVASALTAWKKTDEGKAASQAQIDAWVKARRDAKFEQILAGTLGTRTASVPRATGIEALKRSIAIEWLKAKLAKSGVKLPTGDKTIEVAGTAMTRDELIAATLRNRGDKLQAEAEAEMARRSAFAEEDGGELFA